MEEFCVGRGGRLTVELLNGNSFKLSVGLEKEDKEESGKEKVEGDFHYAEFF